MDEAVVSIALETLRDLLLEEGRFLAGVSSEVRILEAQLEEIKCLLKDADRTRHESDTLRCWIGEIRDLAYRAEDAIETYAAVKSSSRRERRRLRQLLHRCSCILKEGISLHQIGTKISEIQSEIARVTKSMQDHGIRSIIEGEESSGADDNQQWERRTFPFEIEDAFVGKDQELEQLVSLLVDDREHRVISVWGMGGIGKTTLARKVYNHENTKRFFESFAWVCISQQCQIRSVLEDVLKQLNPQRRDDSGSNLSDSELIRQLCEIQKARRCMVVLDDIWKIDHWEGFKHAFLLQGSKSKILFTTRKQNVANIGYAYEVGLLNVDDGWELLKKKSFPHTNVPDFGPQTESFEEVGKKMVKSCGYLPLVISMLGGILSKKQSLKEWELINKNIDDYLFSGGSIDEDNKINAVVLDLSYEDLPSYLKPCFLYMGQFVENEYIYGDNLYMLWIAEGLISVENRASEETTLMDVAELYLSELASRCMVEIVAQGTVSSKGYVFCHLHDVVRELCLSKGKKEDFRLKVVDCRGGRFNVLDPSVLGGKTRYLAVHFRGEVELADELLTTTHEETSEHIRSLKFLCCSQQRKVNFAHVVLEYFRNFKLVRVLVFEGCNFQGRKLPKEIGDLIHLRYLRLRNCEFAELPSSIKNLVYLYTLDLFHSWDVRIPNVLNKLIRLEHLFLPDYRKTSNIARNYQLSLEGLNKLETLVGFNSLFHDWKFVSRMKNLQRLRATVHDTKTLSEIIDDLHTTTGNNLRESTLIIKDGCKLTSLPILNKLFTCPNLHSLWIDVRMPKLQQEVATRLLFPRLVFLTLRKCEIEDDPMQMLETLPCLESLCLWPSSYVGRRMTCRATGFRKLKTLQLWGLPNLTVWKVEKGAMPILSELQIRYCPKLEEIEDELRSITSLEELEISEMAGFGKWASGRKRGVHQCLPCSFRHQP